MPSIPIVSSFAFALPVSRVIAFFLCERVCVETFEFPLYIPWNQRERKGKSEHKRREERSRTKGIQMLDRSTTKKKNPFPLSLPRLLYLFDLALDRERQRGVIVE